MHTFGTAYRVRSLTSADGLTWEWLPGGIDGELGVGEDGAFDSEQRCYVSVVQYGEDYRCWYTGNGFGSTGMRTGVCFRVVSRNTRWLESVSRQGSRFGREWTTTSLWMAVR